MMPYPASLHSHFSIRTYAQTTQLVRRREDKRDAVPDLYCFEITRLGVLIRNNNCPLRIFPLTCTLAGSSIREKSLYNALSYTFRVAGVVRARKLIVKAARNSVKVRFVITGNRFARY